MSQFNLPNLLQPGFQVLNLAKLHPQYLLKKGPLKCAILFVYSVPIASGLLLSFHQLIFRRNNAEALSQNLIAAGGYVEVGIPAA